MLSRKRAFLVIAFSVLLPLFLTHWLFSVAASTSQDCTVPGDFSTIQAAVDDPTCHTISVGSGTFMESVTVSRTVTIAGQGINDTSVDANASDSVFTIRPGAVVTLTDLTITNGGSSFIDGGGIHNDGGILTVVNSHIRDNLGRGGGIYNAGGTISIENSDVVSNSAGFGTGGGIYNDGGVIEISAMMLSGNSGSAGAGILNFGAITIENSTLSDNASTGFGGGLYNSGITATLTVISSTVISNSAAHGGALSNFGGTVNFIDSTLSDNTADFVAGGGGIYNERGTVTLDNSILSANSSTSSGGGIVNRDDGETIIADSIVDGNTADQGGGGIVNFATVYINNSTLSNNSSGAFGGGISNRTDGVISITNSILDSNLATNSGGGISNGGVISITDTTFSGNTATGSGGAISSFGPAIIFKSTLSGNSGSSAGAIQNSDVMVIVDSTISANVSEQGGGGIGNNGTVIISNSTLSGNTAGGSGGGISSFGFSELYISSSTLSGNTSGFGGAGISSGNVVTMSNSIVANSVGGSDCDAPIASGGYNLAGDDSCNLTGPGDQASADPLLGPLQDNGGDTLTHALLSGSPAIDAGSCPDLNSDQRGFVRPVDIEGVTNVADGCDIGAVEIGGVETEEFPVYLPVVTGTVP